MVPSLCAVIALMTMFYTSHFSAAQITLPNVAQTKPFLFPLTKPFIMTTTTAATTTRDSTLAAMTMQAYVAANDGTYSLTTDKYTTTKYTPTGPGLQTSNATEYPLTTSAYTTSTAKHPPSTAIYTLPTLSNASYTAATSEHPPSATKYPPTTSEYVQTTSRYPPSSASHSTPTSVHTPSTVIYTLLTSTNTPTPSNHTSTTFKYDPTTARYTASTAEYPSNSTKYPLPATAAAPEHALTTSGYLSTAAKYASKVAINSTDNLVESVVHVELSVHSASNCSQINGCGMSSQDKIVGGTLASPHEFPWLAHLIIKKGSRSALCTGFLVTNRHVITAAHCTKGAEDDSVRLTLGTNNPSHAFDLDDRRGSGDALRLRSVKIVIHPDYEERGNLNDVSVITVDKPVIFTDIVRPICLPTGDDSYVGVKATIAGWGTLSEGGYITDRLMKATVPVLDNTNSMCVESYGETLKPQMICAGGARMDTCQGDSGGPLMVSKKGIFTAIGIVSFGIGCGRPSTPGVYARITALMPFIDPQISSGKPCSDSHNVVH